MAKEWRTVSEEEKKECDEIAAQNKLKYAEAMKLYQAQVQAVAAAGQAADGEVRWFPAPVFARAPASGADFLAPQANM